MKRNIFLLAYMVVCLSACSKSSNGGGGGNSGGGGTTPTPVVPLVTLAPGWKYSATLSLNFP